MRYLKMRYPRFLCLVLAFFAIPAGAELADVALETVVDGLEDPVSVTNAGDERLFVTLLRGKVVIVRDGEVLAEPFLDFTDRVPRVGHGLHSIAFHPDYRENGFVFLHRADRQTRDGLVTRVRVSSEDPDRVDPASEVVLIRIEKQFGRHYGGQVRFGPDGYLYVSSGDGSGNDSQGVSIVDPQCAALSLASLEGKILRLDVDRNVDVPPYYGVPPDNPFAGSAGPEVWALGLRNPWRFSFDLETGDLWVGDVGEDDREEVDYQPAASPGGESYGWKVMEGSACRGDVPGCTAPVPVCNSPALTPPVIEYSHVGANCSVTGGLVYRGSLVPDLYGRYLYADYCAGTIWAARRDGDVWQSQELSMKKPMTVSFGEDVDGEVYLTKGNELLKFVDLTVPEAGLVEFASPSASVTENAGEAPVTLRRVGGGAGEVAVRVRRAGGTAGNGDFPFTSALVRWADGVKGEQVLTVPVIDDSEDEPDETVVLALEVVEGGAELGARRTEEILLVDDDEPSCLPDGNHLCLNRGRFRVSVAWRTDLGQRGMGRAVQLGEDSGSFWFFSPNNPEIFVKLLNGCFDPFQHYWVFAAGLTEVETTLEVVDTATGQVRRYPRPLNRPYQPVVDTSAFATCP